MHLSQQLKKAHAEELSDAEKYYKMAESAPEKYASILRDIAHEEELHAKHIKSILDDMGCDCDEHETESESENSDQEPAEPHVSDEEKTVHTDSADETMLK